METATETASGRESRSGRKRVRQEEHWKRKKRKLNKDRGAAYTTYVGQNKPAKKVANLTCRCAYRCAEKVSECERERIFEEFYKLKSHDAQNKYLFGLIRRCTVKRPSRSATKRQRSQTFAYHVRSSEGKEVQVCKKSFCDLHAIGKRRVEGLAEKLSAGVLIAGDSRGTHTNRPHAVSEEAKERVREHITSFPRRQSHYSRSDNLKREYLDENLSIARMYSLYLKQYEADMEEPVIKEWLYRKIFNEEFNLSFGYPRSDTCETCDLLRISIQASKSEKDIAQYQGQLAAHQELASQGYRSLRNDAEGSQNADGHTVFTFDLMQNLPVPTLTHGSMFYLRQLWVYNFGIHNSTTGSASMFIWNESIAGRGADEICSCLDVFLEAIPPQIKKLTCYSDSCFGQNKNFQMICFWNQQTLQRFEQVDHKFLVRGHTYLPNDRDFSHIERRKASARVYVPQDWEDVIREACVKNPFNVITMESSNFLDFSEVAKQYTNRKKDMAKQPVLISKALWMNFGQTDVSGTPELHPNELWLKYSYNVDEAWSKVSLLKGRKKTPPLLSVPLTTKYEHGHPIKATKLADLESMIPFLPPEYRQFYKDLIDNAPCASNDTD